MYTIKEQGELNINNVTIINDMIILEECSDLLISLEEFSTTINNAIVTGEALETTTLAILNLVFNNIHQSTGLMIHPPIALEGLTDDNTAVTMEGITEAISSAIKKTRNAINKTIRSFIDKVTTFYKTYFLTIKGLLVKVQTLKVKVANNKSQVSIDKKINVSTELLKNVYVDKGSNITMELDRLNKRILTTSKGGEYEAYLDALFNNIKDAFKNGHNKTLTAAELAEWTTYKKKMLAINLKSEAAFKVITNGMFKMVDVKYSYITSYCDKKPYIGGIECELSIYNEDYSDEGGNDYYRPPELEFIFNRDIVSKFTDTTMIAYNNVDIISNLTALESLLKTIIEHKNDILGKITYMGSLNSFAQDCIGHALNAEDSELIKGNDEYASYIATIKHISSKLYTLTSTVLEPSHTLLKHSIKVVDAVYILCNKSFVANSSK